MTTLLNTSPTDDADTILVSVKVPVSKQLLRDLLCTAIEGGSNYWADFADITRGNPAGDWYYSSAIVTENDPDTAVTTGTVVTPEMLAVGLERLALSSMPTALTHLADALSENGDAITADVVLQFAVFGELVYS
jgi:hypothetical protein